jgi:ribosomal protein S18 acetylase RimI-like enzyme
MNEAHIVRARWRDAWALRDLDRRCFNVIDAYDWFTYLNLCAWPGVVALKAVVGDQIIGFIAGDPRSQTGHVIIVTVSVDPQWRRRGIGERLLRACEAHFAGSSFQLMVRTSNTAAIRLYEKLGYVVVAQVPRYYRNEDGYSMFKTTGNGNVPSRGGG